MIYRSSLPLFRGVLPGFLALALCAPAPSAQARPAAAFQGRPTEMKAGVRARFWIWFDQTGLHLRWTTKGSVRRFGGHIQADAPLQSSPAAVARSAALGLETPDANSLRFATESGGKLVGIDIETQARQVRFSLEMDGTLVPVDWIRLGARGVRPRKNPLTFEASPLDKAFAGPGEESSPHHHTHTHSHGPGRHHHHPHPHPHPPSTGHHHPW